MVRRTSCDRMLCDGLDHCQVIEYIDGIDGVRYVVFECSIVCWSAEDVDAGVFVTIKEGVSKRVVIVVT